MQQYKIRFLKGKDRSSVLEAPAEVKVLPAPCQAECPAGMDIPGFMALIGQGRYREAVGIMLKDNPLPYICGLVCPAPCEKVCLRQGLDEAVSIRAMKEVAARQALNRGGYPKPETAPASGKKAAVIGSGPAGLTAAYFLALKGHSVTVFEARQVIGGMMVLGIPAFRLPRKVIEAEIGAIEDLGVIIKTKKALGIDFTLEDLRGQGFETIFLGNGAQLSNDLGLGGGKNLAQIQDGLTFLRNVALGQGDPPAEEVVVIGGGNTAMDVARTCIRLGCRKVTVAYRRTRLEMPAHDEEISQALEEGVEIRFLTIPKEIVVARREVKGLICLKAELGPPDALDRRKPLPVEGSQWVLPAGAIISAVGQAPDLTCLGSLARDEGFCHQTILVDPDTGQTKVPWIFAGGDAVTGPATVVSAVAAGKKAAAAMDGYLRGLSLIDRIPSFTSTRVEPLEVPAEERSGLHRSILPLGRADRSKTDFQLIEPGLTEEMAQNEARRCLRCDLCTGCGFCQEVCHEMGVEALSFKPTSRERLVFYDFVFAPSRCIGCGACALTCPTGALRVKEKGPDRQILFTGTVIKRHQLIHCKQCDRYYFPTAQMAYLRKRLEIYPTDYLDLDLCPRCARLYWGKALSDEVPQ
jgi:NADH-quinone oxidoreductase subunit F